MVLRIGGMGMDEESIRQDRELARAAIKGLTSYAEQIAHQGKDEEIGQPVCGGNGRGSGHT